MLKRLVSTIVSLLIVGAAAAQAPTTAIVMPTAIICANSGVVLNSISTNTPTSFNWAINPATGVNVFTSSNQPSVGVTFAYPGVYSVSLTVSNASGTFVATQSTSVSATPRAMFNASLVTAGFPNQIVLTNFSSGASSYLWSYSETASTDNTTDALHNYTASGPYSVSLTAISSDGCTDVSTYSFFISDSSGVSLPNVFTPNGDGVNDIYKPISRGIKSMNVNIYSRYGNIVASWNTVNGHWDGRTPSGIACESGTYFIVVEATGFDGKNYNLKEYISLFSN